MSNTGPESAVPPAASGGAGGRPGGTDSGDQPLVDSIRRQRGEGRADLTFEEAQRELETIVERLERGQTGLDEALALWERGEHLYRLCRGKLDAAEGKIEELGKRVEAAAP